MINHFTKSQNSDYLQNIFTGHLSNIVGCKFSPDSALLVTASWDTKVNIWDCHSGELKRSLCHIVPPPQLVFSPNIRALSLNKFSTAISTGLLSSILLVRIFVATRVLNKIEIVVILK